METMDTTTYLQGSIVGGNTLVISMYVAAVTIFNVRPGARTWVLFNLVCLGSIEGLKIIEIVLQGFPNCWTERSDISTSQRDTIETVTEVLCGLATLFNMMQIIFTPVLLLNAMVKDSSFWQGEFFTR